MSPHHHLPRARLACIPFAVLCLGTAMPVSAQVADVQVKTLVSLTGESGAALGSRPFYPPQWSTSENRLVGTTRSGTPTAPGNITTQGVAYRLDPLAASAGYTTTPLSVDIGFSITNLVQLSDGRMLGGSSHAAALPSSPYTLTRTMFTLGQGSTQLEALPPAFPIAPRGQMSLDGAGRVYLSGSQGNCDPAVPSGFLVRRTAGGTYENLFSFCDPSAWSTSTASGAGYSKGGVPGLTWWSEADQALYGVSNFTASKGEPYYAGVPADDAANGALVRISKAALDKEKLAASDVEVLHFFARKRDGTIGVSDTGNLALTEDGDWLYGTMTQNTTSSQGRVWRMHKSMPDSFATAIDFAVDLSTTQEVRPEGVPALPRGQLVRAADGNLYGVATRDSRQIAAITASRRAPVGAGVVYRIVPGVAADRADDKLEVVHYFDPQTTGASPVGLTAGPVVNGRQLLFGATEYGGAAGDTCYVATSSTAGNSNCTGHGTVFQVSIGLPPVSIDAFQGNASTDVTLAPGSRLTLDWATTGASRCVASGDWSGTKQASGTEEVGPLPAGRYTYTLACASDAGVSSAPKSVAVTVNAPADGGAAGTSGGGGGGPLAPYAILAVALLGIRRWIIRTR